MKFPSASALALVAAVLVTPLAYAHADTTPGFYLGAGLGATFTPDLKTRPNSGKDTINYNTGWNVNGSGGYAWDNGLRAEGEVFYSRATINKLKNSGVGSGGLENTDFFANGFYDFRLGSMFTPYIGAGLGLAVVGAQNEGVLGNHGNLNDAQAQFAYQGIVGAAAQLDPNWAVTADYRYIATTDPKFSTTTTGSARTDNSSHNIIVGLRYSFGGPAVKPAAETTTAPRAQSTAVAKPIIAPVPQNYLVFFDFDKSELTVEAKRILASAAQDFKRDGYIRVVVTGHTDTVGTASYNQKLSERRAKAVTAELESLGLDAKEIKTIGTGKKDLLVPTADGVREAQNRRAEIVFGK